MESTDASALADLQVHWDEAYVIGLDGDIWSARFRTSTDELRAHTSTELRELIRSDYTYRQRAGLTIRDPAEGADDADDSDDSDDSDDESLADGSSGSGRDEADDRSVGGGEDAPSAARRVIDDVGVAAAGRRPAEDVDFAAIRGERMST